MGCQNDDNKDSNPVNKDIDFTSHSQEPAFVYGMGEFGSSLQISTLISSSDKVIL